MLMNFVWSDNLIAPGWGVILTKYVKLKYAFKKPKKPKRSIS